MNKVEAGENVQRQAKQSKAAPEGASKKKKLAPPSLKSLEGLPDDFNKGGKATKKVPVISIGVGMAEMPKGKGKAKMMRGGMSGGKEHMYAAGGMVKDNPGLKALKAASPEAYSKITGK